MVYILYLEFLHMGKQQQNNLNISSVPVKAGAFCTMDKRGKIACSSLINQI